ncbi:MAG: hypothetical protein ACFB10_16010 [Salibacteraceae bacterium]
MPTEKLSAVRVSLQEWQAPDPNTLVLRFKKVPPYTYKTDYRTRTPSTTVFSDFGYLKLTLRGKLVGNRQADNWLNAYIDDDQLYLEEEYENEITFWEGEDEDRYDWMSSYSIAFDAKKVEWEAISNEEWQALYTEMVLNWKKESDFNHQKYEHWYSLFFMIYKRVVQTKVKSILPNPIPKDLLDYYESSLKSHLEAWLTDVEEKRKEF